jgi:hypothetical protein
MDTKRLCELTSAADSLQLKPLVDLTSRALARIIEGKTPEEIREIFHLPDDLTEVFGACANYLLRKFFILYDCNIDSVVQEEKLEPLKNITDDPRIRLLNRLYAKKRKELKERERIKVTMSFYIFSFSFLPSSYIILNCIPTYMAFQPDAHCFFFLLILF